MGDFINKLRELNVGDEDFVTLNYTEGADVWHINESHVEDAVGETSTASLLAGLLTSGVAVTGMYGDGDILDEMRSNGLLEDYERGEENFQEYVADKLRETIYDGDYALAYSTEQYDFKRGRCDISTNVRVRAGDLMAADASSLGRYTFFSADSFVSGFDVSVKTPAGTLTLS